jgi:hypothetical protein
VRVLWGVMGWNGFILGWILRLEKEWGFWG